MLSATPIAPSPDGSPPAVVVSAGLAALARERTARRAAEALAARLEAENAEIAEQVRRLEHLNDELRKLLFGKKSEKLGADERQLSFDDLGTAVSEARRRAGCRRTGRGSRTPPATAAVGAPRGTVPGSYRAPRRCDRARQHAVPLRLRRDDEDRRGPQRASRHRAGAVPGDRDGAPGAMPATGARAAGWCRRRLRRL